MKLCTIILIALFLIVALAHGHNCHGMDTSVDDTSVDDTSGMKRVPAIRKSIARTATLACRRVLPTCNYNDRSTPLEVIKEYFDELFAQMHDIFEIDIEFLAQMRRVKANIMRAPTVRAGYVSAIRYLEHKCS